MGLPDGIDSNTVFSTIKILVQDETFIGMPSLHAASKNSPGQQCKSLLRYLSLTAARTRMEEIARNLGMKYSFCPQDITYESR